ncbi:MAG: GFA family protein [Alphaproteobacteria bacterium]|nr:GFA family protein [Alphaproteobacteria bacterium]
MTPLVVDGGCHCGAVRFRVTLREPLALDCNCSICRLKGFLHLIVPPEDFQLLQGAERLTEYRFNTRVAVHRFCSVCGTHPFYTPRSHPDQVDVNARCLDGGLPEGFNVQPFDGQRWEDNVEGIR